MPWITNIRLGTVCRPCMFARLPAPEFLDVDRSDSRKAKISRLADACCRGLLRLLDCNDQFRAAFVARLFPDALVANESLGPRRLRFRCRDTESVVGHRPTLRRRDCRSLRHKSCA